MRGILLRIIDARRSQGNEIPVWVDPISGSTTPLSPSELSWVKNPHLIARPRFWRDRDDIQDGWYVITQHPSLASSFWTFDNELGLLTDKALAHRIPHPVLGNVQQIPLVLVLLDRLSPGEQQGPHRFWDAVHG